MARREPPAIFGAMSGSPSMRSRLLAPLLALTACGPASNDLPPSGIYQIEAMTLENGCDPRLSDATKIKEIVKVEADAIRIAFSDFIGIASDCEGCAPLTTWQLAPIPFNPDEDRYVREDDRAADGCELRETIELEILDDQAIRAHITNEWLGACPWMNASPEGCTEVRQYDYTLVEACEDCKLSTGQSL